MIHPSSTCYISESRSYVELDVYKWWKVMDEKDKSAAHSTNVVQDQEFIDELKHLLTVARHPRTLELLQDAIKEADGSSSVAKEKNNGTVNNIAEDRGSNVVGREIAGIRASNHSKASIASKPTTRIKDYGWDQSETFVKIYITSVTGLAQDNVVKNFTERSMMVQFSGASGKIYSIVMNDLFGTIVPEQSHVKVKSGNATICLRKKEKDEWPFLTGREKKLKDARESKPPNLDKDEDPGQGLMKLMKQMYNEGDDEMKRTIAKAWHESQEKRAKGTDDLL